MFNYDKVIQNHLDVLSKYDDPEELEKHMRSLYSQYKLFIVLTFVILFTMVISMVIDDPLRGFDIVLIAIFFTMAVNRWIDLQNLVLYKSLRDNGVLVQQQQESTDI